MSANSVPRHILACTPSYDPNMEAHGNWATSWSRCQGCLMPMRYTDAYESKEDHLLKCKGWELHMDLNGFCADGKNCRIREEAHWSSLFH